MRNLTDLLEKGLEKLSKIQQKYCLLILISLLIITGVILYTGVPRLEFQSDFSEMQPDDLPISKLTSDVNQDFNSLETIIILVQLDDEVQSKYSPTDIRDPEIIEFLLRLERNLKEEVTVQEVQSIGSFFAQTGAPKSIDQVKGILNQVPQTNNFISRDYSMTTVFVSADIGMDAEKVKSVVNKVDNIIEYSSPPSGVKIITTGDAPLGSTVFDLIISDAELTALISIIFIFVLLLILQKSVKDSLIIILTLSLGIGWTLGLMGLLKLPLNVGTAGVFAILIGLGVEYGIFLLSRYKEERQDNPKSKAHIIALSNVGAAVASSGGTTVIGFFALSTSIFPVLQELGKSLGIGILMLIISTLFALPIFLIVEEKVENLIKIQLNIKKRKSIKFNFKKLFRKYGKLVSKKPGVFVIIGLIITGFMIVSAQNINNQDIDFEAVLPDDIEEMNAFFMIQDEFGETTETKIYVGVDPSSIHTNEPLDVREYQVLKYVDILTQKSGYVDNVVSVSSISEIAKNANNGKLPKTISSKTETYEPYINNLVSEDYSYTLIKLTIDADSDYSDEEIVRQLNEILDNTEKPAGLETEVIGSIASNVEINKLFGPDSGKTSIIAILAIVLFLFLLSYSIKGTLLPIFTVVFGIIWVMGLLGISQLPFNNITSSVLTMTIGIGIDFGIQLRNRYEYELKSYDKRKAMEETLSNVLTPMIITVIAAIIGFRAMVFGKLSLIGDLGVAMSFSLVACMLVSVTIIAGLLVILKKENKSKKSDVSSK